MLTPTERQGLINRIHGRVFISALADTLGLPCEWYVLAQAEKACFARTYQLGTNRKYRSCLNGALLRADTRVKWCVAQPDLLDVELNPLWEVLPYLASPRIEWNSRAGSITVNGLSVLRFSDAQQLWVYPTWTRLAYLAMLLRTQHPRFIWHRAAISSGFSTYLELVCLQPPLIAAARDLFELFSDFIRCGLFAVEIAHWPASFKGFLAHQNLLQEGIEYISRWGKPGTPPAELAALLWILTDEKWQWFDWEGERLPRSLRDVWRASVLSARHDVICWSYLER